MEDNINLSSIDVDQTVNNSNCLPNIEDDDERREVSSASAGERPEISIPGTSTEGNLKFSSIAVQTPLTLAKFAMIKPSAVNVKFPYSEDQNLWYRLAISDANIYDPCPNVSALRPKEMSFKFSHEATTQATPPHPLLISKRSPKKNVADMSSEVLGASTSLSSNVSSTPRSEIVTVMTDYGNRIPDSPILVADAANASTSRVSKSLQSDQALSMSLSQEAAQGSEETDVPSGIRSPCLTNAFARRNQLSIKNLLPCIFNGEDEPETLPSPSGAPPTYSSIYAGPLSRSNARRAPVFLHGNSSSFVAPIPPPSYAQAQGIYLTPYSLDQTISSSTSFSIWSPRPVATVCPRCVSFVITTVEVRRSLATHVAAFLLCLCGCWPCCMMPYCIDACKSADHYCPVCHTYLGTYARF